MPDENEEVVPEAEPTLRDDLESAIEAAEGELDGSPAAPAQAEGASEEQAGAGEEETGEPAAAEAPSDYPDDSQRYPGLTGDRMGAAPEGWRPGAREGWKDLPEGVRREIHRREMDIAAGMQESAGARTSQERLNGLAQTYGAAMAAEGLSDPLDAVQGLFETAATLRMGTPNEKAQKIVTLINHYAVDLNTLDGALAAAIGGEGAAPPGNGALDPAVEAQLKPMREFMQSVQGRMQQADQARGSEAASSVAEFRNGAEFLEDVRMDMADLLDMASNRGRPMSLQEAYDAACQMNPEIRGVLSQRTELEALTTGNNRVDDKIAAATTSIAGRQGPTEGPQSDGSLRGDIVRAMEELEDR